MASQLNTRNSRVPNFKKNEMNGKQYYFVLVQFYRKEKLNLCLPLVFSFLTSCFLIHFGIGRLYNALYLVSHTLKLNYKFLEPTS